MAYHRSGEEMSAFLKILKQSRVKMWGYVRDDLDGREASWEDQMNELQGFSVQRPYILVEWD